MTTPATPSTTPDRMTASELRAAFELIERELSSQMDMIIQIKAQLDTLGNGLQVLGSMTDTSRAPINTADDGASILFSMDTIKVSIGDDGKTAYKACGGQYAKFGVRIWPETLPALGLVVEDLKPGPNPINPPISVRALLTDAGQPRKVISKA